MEARALAANIELNMLVQTRRALRLLLAQPAARAPGLAHVRDLEIAGAAGSLRARYYEPAHADPGPLLLFFHGGGFVCGDIDTHDSITSWLAKTSGLRVLSVGYRLAPETLFPGQIDDARAACAWALSAAGSFGAASEKLCVGGDSAGAYLAMTCALELNARRAGTVPAQALLYPLVHIDRTLWAEEELRNFRFVGRLATLYIAAKLGAEHFPSLLELDLTHAPATVLASGGALDPVRADVKTLATALKAAGVRVAEKKYPVLMHGGLNFTAVSKLAVNALTDVGAALREELAR
ncbi:MAG TPA: alpha/beta hydrolase [Caulobacterales bacterium]|nr:alpha/beta hydrolase [Caulobacterales bacterium]